MNKSIIILFLFLLLISCTIKKPDVVIIDERTNLEDQVLGYYEELNEETDGLVAVYRAGPDSNNTMKPIPTHINESHLPILEVMSEQRTKRIFIISLMIDEQLVAENNKGYLEFRPPQNVKVPKDEAERIKTIIEEENERRLYINKKIIELDDELILDDLAEVEMASAKYYQALAPVGTWIQRSNGWWIQKSEFKDEN